MLYILFVVSTNPYCSVTFTKKSNDSSHDHRSSSSGDSTLSSQIRINRILKTQYVPSCIGCGAASKHVFLHRRVIVLCRIQGLIVSGKSGVEETPRLGGDCRCRGIEWATNRVGSVGIVRRKGQILCPKENSSRESWMTLTPFRKSTPSTVWPHVQMSSPLLSFFPSYNG